MQLPSALPSPSPKKPKKLTQNEFLIFPDMEPSSCNIKKIIIFSQKKTFLIFPQMKPCTFHTKPDKQKKSILGKFLILQETKTPKKQTKNSALKKFLVSYDVFAIFTSVKHKEIPCEVKI